MLNYFVPPATHKFGQQAAGLLTGLCFSISASVQLSPAQERDIGIRSATGDNLAGDLGAAAGNLQLAQGLQNGDSLVIANGVNVISEGALDSAMNEAIGGRQRVRTSRAKRLERWWCTSMTTQMCKPRKRKSWQPTKNFLGAWHERRN